MMLPKTFVSVVLVAFCISCGGSAQQPPKTRNDESSAKIDRSSTKNDKPSAKIDKSTFDDSVRPQDDFYRYVNGTWLKETKMPGDRSDYGAFSIVGDTAEAQLRAILDELRTKEGLAQGSTEQKVSDYYASLLDASNRDDVDLTYLKPEMAMIDGIKSKADFYEVAAALQIIGVKAPLGYGIESDLKDPNRYGFYLGQAGLTLPDRDYYLKDTERYKKARKLLVTYADTLMGFAKSGSPGKDILSFETKLAKVSWPKEELRKPEKQYNPKTRRQLGKQFPKVAWDKFLGATDVPKRETYIVTQPSYVKALGGIIAKAKLRTLKAYLKFQTLARFASVLGKPAFEARFAFARKGLRGVKEPRPAWKRAVSRVNGSIGELVGQIYVKRHFGGDAKPRMQKLVKGLTSAYGTSIKKLDWMSEATKKQALVKLSTFAPKIGYPDKWIDFSELSLKRNAVLAEKSISLFWHRRDARRIDTPVDKSEWGMPPQTVNAYYNPLWNEIVFPAAILQPPFFDLSGDDAVNYGAIGAVIGHEIGHGFDDQGRKFDSQGRLRDWWTDADAKEFERRKNQLAKQYDSFKVIDNQTINGQFTSGENIGDLGGLSIAYKAYRNSLGGKEAPIIDGMTGDQRFFVGWAKVWARLYTDEELKQRLVVDPHSPSEARVNVVVRNIPAFHKAFDVKKGDKLYLTPENQVKIW